MTGGAAFGFVGAALSVAAIIVASAWETKPRAAASVESAELPSKPAIAFDPQQAFVDFHAKLQAEQHPARPQFQSGQPWSLNPPPGRPRPIIIDLNAHRTEL